MVEKKNSPIKNCRIRKVKMCTSICIQRLCQVEMVPDDTDVVLGRFHCNITLNIQRVILYFV